MPPELGPDAETTSTGPERSALLESLFGAGAIATKLRGTGDPATLLPDERRCAATFVAKRLAEFAAGRACARGALRGLGVAHHALPIRPDRGPDWPPEFTGSITHTEGHCGAVVTRTRDFAAIGLDVERVGRVTPDLWERLFVANELAQLRALDVSAAARIATLLFSAKEAVYKCRFPLTGGWLDFTDVEIAFSRSATSTQGSFSVALVVPDRFTALNRLAGRYVVDDDVVWTGVAVAATIVV